MSKLAPRSKSGFTSSAEASPLICEELAGAAALEEATSRRAVHWRLETDRLAEEAATTGSQRRRATSAYWDMSTGVWMCDADGLMVVAGPKPVAITVIFTLPFSAGSTPAPKMMFAS